MFLNEELEGVSNLVGSGYWGHTTKYDKTTTALTEYFGYAPCGTADASPLWTIKKTVTDGSGNIVVTWANSGIANQVWANRTTLTYS
jgi:hypothetical protein